MRFTSSRLFSADLGNSDGKATAIAYEARTAKELGFQEGWLQNAIAKDPPLVIDACEQAGLTDELWFFWDREFNTEAGPIDLLLVSESGRVAIVETKLAYNPEKRRSVVAQVLDYAVNLPRVSLDALPQLPKEAREIGVRMERVEARIREGDYLLVIAGDQLDARAVRLGSALLGDHLTRSWELAMVEVAVFEAVGGIAGPRFVLVPHLHGLIQPEVRQIVRVKVSGAQLDEVIVERPGPGTSTIAREKWTEERFLGALESSALGPEYRAFARDLLALRQTHRDLEIRWGTSFPSGTGPYTCVGTLGSISGGMSSGNRARVHDRQAEGPRAGRVLRQRDARVPPRAAAAGARRRFTRPSR